MKKTISFLLAVLFVVSSCLVNVGATDVFDIKNVMTVSKSGLVDDAVTYTVRLSAGKSVSNTVIKVKYDTAVMSVKAAGVCNGISGELIQGVSLTDNTVYSFGFVSARPIKAGSADMDFLYITFQVKDDVNRNTTTEIAFSCTEYGNNILQSDAPQTVATFDQSLLGTPIVKINKTSGHPLLSWNVVDGAESYQICRKSTGDWEYIGSTTLSTYTDNTTEKCVEYIYTVRAANSACTSDVIETEAVVFHDYYSEWSVDKAPTCTTKGSKSYHCKNCTVKKDVTDIAATGHKMQLTTAGYDSTCAKLGKTALYTCANGCGHTEGGETVAKKSHDYSLLWTVDVEPTCTEKGSKSHHCKNCDDKKTITAVKETGHDYQNSVCTKCGDWANKETELALGKVTNQNGSVKLTWSAIEGATGYIVYRKAGSETKWSKMATVTSLSYTDKSVKSGTKYTYTVKPICGKIGGQYDATGLSVLYLAQPAVKVSNQNGSVKVSWAKCGGAKSYIVYRKAGSETSWTKLAVISGTAYTDKSVKSGTNYTYTVKAVNGSEKSAYNTKGVVTKYLAQPTLGTPVSAKAGVTVKWGKVTGATGYIVYRKTGSGSWVKLATVKGNTKVSYLDKSAEKGKTYTYTVKAYYSSYYSTYNTKGITVKDKY